MVPIGISATQNGPIRKDQTSLWNATGTGTHESKNARIYSPLGLAKSDQGEYKEAMTFFEKSLEI